MQTIAVAAVGAAGAHIALAVAGAKAIQEACSLSDGQGAAICLGLMMLPLVIGFLAAAAHEVNRSRRYLDEERPPDA